MYRAPVAILRRTGGGVSLVASEVIGSSRTLSLRSGTRLSVSTDSSILTTSDVLPFLLPKNGFRSAPTTVTRTLHTSVVLNADAVVIEGPAFADSISEGDIRWLKQVGDFVTEDEIVAEIETDKTTMEVPAQQAGTIESFLVADGDKVTAKQKLYRLIPGGEASAASTPPPAKKEDIPSPPPPPAAAAPPPVATKRVRTQFPASAAGPIPTQQPPVAAPPTQPMQSIPAVTTVRPPPPPPPPSSRTFGSAPVGPSPPTGVALGHPVGGGVPLAVPKGVNPEQAITGSRAETRVKMNRMRQRIAQRLKDAQNTYAMLTTFQEVDMSNIVEMRKRYGDAFHKRHGIKLGFMSPFIRAAAYALMDFPQCNAVIDEGEIVYRHFIDLSIAVATPRGLVVPVLRNVEAMNYAQIEAELNALGEKARDNRIAIEDMEGGTFTISNGGVFGSLYGTPIINPPQSAILGMHATVDRPVAIQGKVEIRPMMVIALTYDHRLIDGREAVTFLKKIKTSVEDPRSMLLGL